MEAWLALWRAPGLGPKAVAEIREHHGSPRHFLDAGRRAWQAMGLDAASLEALAHPDQAAIDADLEWAEAPDHHLLTLDDPRYPERLRGAPAAPPVLFVNGDLDCLAHPQLAIVGSRHASATGRETAEDFARHLAAWGMGITSGLAAGIDTAAHRGALAAEGITVAVMATGPDRIYPAANRELAHRIAATGALVTEFPTGVGTRAGNFPRRNRIISGLAVGTLVVEAGLRSGSLITARYALEQGREVFAIPGSIHNPLARGCHALIRQGCKLVETAEHIWEELPPLGLGTPAPVQPTDGVKPGTPPFDKEQQQVMEALGYEPTAVDTLVERTGLTAEVVSSILLLLELEGYVTACPGGRYTRAG